jgi:hypothetical protein
MVFSVGEAKGPQNARGHIGREWRLRLSSSVPLFFSSPEAAGRGVVLGGGRFLLRVIFLSSGNSGKNKFQ